MLEFFFFIKANHVFSYIHWEFKAQILSAFITFLQPICSRYLILVDLFINQNIVICLLTLLISSPLVYWMSLYFSSFNLSTSFSNFFLSPSKLIFTLEFQLSYCRVYTSRSCCFWRDCLTFCGCPPSLNRVVILPIIMSSPHISNYFFVSIISAPHVFIMSSKTLILLWLNPLP